MPGLAYDPTSVNDQLNRITSGSNPLMTQARSRGERSAGRRGLLNSSIAGQAGEAAVLDVALPMASQEATQRFGTSEREATQGWQTGEREATQDWQTGERKAGQIYQTHERLGTQKFNERLEKGRIASTERIATMNLDAQRQQAAAQFAAQMEAQYTGLFQSLMSNPNLSGEDRTAYMEHFGNMRNSNYNLIEQMYNIDLDWENPTFTENAPPANTNTNTGGNRPAGSNPQQQNQPIGTVREGSGNSGGNPSTPGGINGVERSQPRASDRPDPYGGRSSWSG